jgi:adenosylcobinamide kinase/adenosylcobinamide-phosphate guanylyltransferase
MKNLTLIVGGARSGKSKLAEKLGRQARTPVFYFATMHERADDGEQSRRIERHRLRRPADWQTVVIQDDLMAAVRDLNSGPSVVIVDCLSLYVADFLMRNFGEDAHGDQVYECEDPLMTHLSEVLQAMEQKSDVQFVVVSNEVGSGVVPVSALGRAYRDLLGAASQLFAAQAEIVYLMCVGIPLQLKPTSANPGFKSQ